MGKIFLLSRFLFILEVSYETDKYAMITKKKKYEKNKMMV